MGLNDFAHIALYSVLVLVGSVVVAYWMTCWMLYGHPWCSKTDWQPKDDSNGA